MFKLLSHAIALTLLHMLLLRLPHCCCFIMLQWLQWLHYCRCIAAPAALPRSRCAANPCYAALVIAALRR